ncbi:lasso peptide biosynthesis B2 protein [Desulfofustis glycolicus]|uniref:Transglutaminase-like superfamily protein n=1 Tax=Desulfofustis glycolicus DSM 9705 TaxID=1121409 RepID=A0A1M5X6Z7_9BACT|nr:lasso peptide biosynthesis B2 protein [Desulfofustis glycolicus]MCB2216043.1 lasso peptide biosynthesis B2 protein [Desulfobulbaceae bacterium]SHH95274.1 Transglutaminase-like superfamily protein [Desulfofustis glycolicus DSM 9705]
MTARLRKFVRLPAGEKRCFCRAVGLLAYYRLALLVIPLQRLLRNRSRQPAAIPATMHVDAGRLAGLIRSAATVVPGTTCLVNSLAGQRLFAGYGYPAKLHVGVAKDRRDGFQAHAWLTLADEIVVGELPDMAKYRELPDLDSALSNRPTTAAVKK